MAIQRLFLFALAATRVLAAAVDSGEEARSLPSSRAKSCKVLPGDQDWPNSNDWQSLNKTLNGRLIASVPLGSVCHDAPFNNYNADQCAALQSSWNETKLSYLDSPADFFDMYFKNYTCDPFTPRSRPCELGNYASYVIEVRGAADVVAGVNFARKYNVRLAIKNTGHDYAGKSTGKGALSLWTSKLDSTDYIPNYKSSYYNGPALKLGAGIRGYAAYAAAHATGNRIVGGSCPTVGIAGGYTQGGGHSMLASAYGMAADNVLEWEVVTMNGSHLVATPEKNSDLYWALSGGGGGNYGVVLSMTRRLHPDSIVGGATFTFNDTKVGNDKFWDAIGAFHEILPPFVDSGNSFLYVLTNKEFLAWSITMPGADLNKTNALVKPFLDDLKKRGIDYDYSSRVSNSYYEHYSFYLGPLPEGTSNYATFTGSRIIPRALLTDPEKNPVVIDALRNTTLAEGYSPMPCQTLNVNNKNQSHPDNAVLPAWRDAMTVCVTAGNWDPTAPPAEMAARQDYAANILQPMLADATPGGGVYLNEANFRQPNWQEELYGTNYQRLLQIKKTYDPESLLYVHTGVGSEAWFEDADNRLCQA